MKVLFLDFDGVIVPLGKASLSDKAVGEAVKNMLAFINSEKDLKIVISSAWRKHGLGYCQRFLQGLGFDPARVIGVTGDERGERGYQIQCYLKRNPSIKQFVIVDDNSDMGNLMMKLVKTNSLIGFTKPDVERAKEILNS